MDAPDAADVFSSISGFLSETADVLSQRNAEGHTVAAYRRAAAALRRRDVDPAKVPRAGAAPTMPAFWTRFRGIGPSIAAAILAHAEKAGLPLEAALEPVPPGGGLPAGGKRGGVARPSRAGAGKVTDIPYAAEGVVPEGWGRGRVPATALSANDAARDALRASVMSPHKPMGMLPGYPGAAAGATSFPRAAAGASGFGLRHVSPAAGFSAAAAMPGLAAVGGAISPGATPPNARFSPGVLPSSTKIPKRLLKQADGDIEIARALQRVEKLSKLPSKKVAAAIEKEASRRAVEDAALEAWNATHADGEMWDEPGRAEPSGTTASGSSDPGRIRISGHTYTFGSGTYAILLAMFRCVAGSHGHAKFGLYLTRDQICDEAQRYCRAGTIMRPEAAIRTAGGSLPQSNDYYSGFSSMADLVKRGLVSKHVSRNAQFILTQDGIIVARLIDETHETRAALLQQRRGAAQNAFIGGASTQHGAPGSQSATTVALPDAGAHGTAASARTSVSVSAGTVRSRPEVSTSYEDFDEAVDITEAPSKRARAAVPASAAGSPAAAAPTSTFGRGAGQRATSSHQHLDVLDITHWEPGQDIEVVDIVEEEEPSALGRAITDSGEAEALIDLTFDDLGGDAVSRAPDPAPAARGILNRASGGDVRPSPSPSPHMQSHDARPRTSLQPATGPAPAPPPTAGAERRTSRLGGVCAFSPPWRTLFSNDMGGAWSHHTLPRGERPFYIAPFGNPTPLPPSAGAVDGVAILLVDTRECNNDILMRAISAVDVPWRRATLPIGDYLWVAQPCTTAEKPALVAQLMHANGAALTPQQEVTLYTLGFVAERKRVDDFVLSVTDHGQRFGSQKQRLLKCGLSRLMYIVEGDPAMPQIASSAYKTEAIIRTGSRDLTIEGFAFLETRCVVHTSARLASITHSVARTLSQRRDWAQPGNLMTKWVAHNTGVRKEVRRILDIWGAQLKQINRLPVRMIELIAHEFPTPARLLDALDACPPHERSHLLSDLPVPSGVGGVHDADLAGASEGLAAGGAPGPFGSRMAKISDAVSRNVADMFC